MGTILIAAVVCILAVIGVAVPLCRAAKVGDGQLADCALRDGHPDIAAVYLQGGPA